GRELTFKAERIEGFDGPIRIDLDGLPPGFTSSAPLEIEAGQASAVAVVYAAPDAQDPPAALDGAVQVTASAVVAGTRLVHHLGTLGDLQLGAPPKLTVMILPAADHAQGMTNAPGQPLELTLTPGQTLTARVRAVRNDFAGRIELGNEDSGRNLPHGVYVDNIGLNGLLIVEGQTEREFFVTASRIAQPGVRRFHLRARGDDGQASPFVTLRVLPPSQVATRSGRE
ncbi:MAG: hypothetical protein IT580_23490, partial [Verrucomicrobiales bacterium]|nr:hypothetical protein [Verrucomicrobiales bacterium]